MLVLIDGVRYRLVTPQSEDAFEEIIRDNYRHIFGPDSIYFDKRKIRSSAGIGSIPDGYIIFFDPEPKWCVLEVELASHPIYEHLIPQLTKFNRAIDDTSTREKLVKTFYHTINTDEVLKARIKQKIGSGEIYKFVSDAVSTNPVIVVAIDEQTHELQEALRDIRGSVKVLEFRVFQREGVSDGVNAYVFDEITKAKVEKPKTEITRRQPKRGSQRATAGFISKTAESFAFLGETVRVDYFCEILLKICEMMKKRHPDGFEEVLLGLRKTKYPCFSVDKRELMGEQGTKISGTNIYAATKLHSNAMVDRCKLVVESFGHNPEDLQIRTRDS